MGKKSVCLRFQVERLRAPYSHLIVAHGDKSESVFIFAYLELLVVL